MAHTKASLDLLLGIRPGFGPFVVVGWESAPTPPWICTMIGRATRRDESVAALKKNKSYMCVDRKKYNDSGA